MQTERTFIEELKFQYKYGGATIRLILINAAVFLFITFSEITARLIGGTFSGVITDILTSVFALDTNPQTFFFKPWGIFTSIFAHFTFFHFLFNMLFLYFSGKMFETLFDHKRLIYTYLLGGIMGGALELLAHLIFPALQNQQSVVVGASGSIMAIFMALAFYRPNLSVMLFGIIPVRLILLAVIFLLQDLYGLATNDGTAHFAHLGGALIGFISVQSIYSSSNIINRVQSWGDKFLVWISKPSGSGLKVKKGGKTRSTMHKADSEYNIDNKARQEKTDAILDKISKSGYESLTKAEKEFLFNQSKK